MDVVLLSQVAVVVAVLVAVWVVSDWSTYVGRARRIGRRLGVLAPEPPAPPGRPPIERIAADVRRIGSAVHHVPPGTPVARRRGWLAAYDDVLIDACRALALEHALESLPPGPRRELERERVERMLVRSGLLTDQGAER